jgi:hypothetical protein
MLPPQAIIFAKNLPGDKQLKGINWISGAWHRSRCRPFLPGKQEAGGTVNPVLQYLYDGLSGKKK